MPGPSLFRYIKRWRRYVPADNLNIVPQGTRGLYVLYRQTKKRNFDVMYIGVSGLRTNGRLLNRLRKHRKRIGGWTHFSFFEIHDNVTANELRELETLFITIFRDDSKVRLENIQGGSKTLSKLKSSVYWPEYKRMGDERRRVRKIKRKRKRK